MVQRLIITLAARCTAAVQLAGDRVRDVRQLLLLLLEVLGGGGSRVLLKPVSGLLDSVEDLSRLLVLKPGKGRKEC